MTDLLQLDENILEDLYSWIDLIPLSRPKRDLKRDFSDGVLVAEVVKHFIPSIVEMHNYSSALAVNKKLINWHILNRKVCRKLGFEVNDGVLKNIVTCQPFAIEQFLILLRARIDRSLGHKAKSDQPEADQAEDMASPHDSRIRKASSIQPITGISHSPRIKTTVAKMSESDSFSPFGTMTLHKSFVSVPKSLPGDTQLKKNLEEKDGQLKTKDETIEILQAKIHRLEQLLQLKDIRIEDLQTRLNDARTPNTVLKRRK